MLTTSSNLSLPFAQIKKICFCLPFTGTHSSNSQKIPPLYCTMPQCTTMKELNLFNLFVIILRCSVLGLYVSSHI